MSALRKTVETESSRVSLELGQDFRLVPAVAGAAEHFAVRSGFDAHDQTDLITAVEDACWGTLPMLAGTDDTLKVVIESHRDRIEVTLEYHGAVMPQVGLEAFVIPAKGYARGGGLGLLARVDRIEHKSLGGTSRMTLVKYLHATKA